MFDSLLAVYSDPAVLRQATADRAAECSGGGRVRAEAVAAIDSELRKTEAVERYMFAFEGGTLTPDVFSERVEQLSRQAQRLRSSRGG